MSGTLTIANVLRAGKAGTLPALLAANGIQAKPATATPTAPTPLTPAMVALMPDTRTDEPAVLNANRNVIGVDTTAAPMPASSLAPMPTGMTPAGTDWKALLKKWWPWIVLVLLAVAVMLSAGKRSRKSD